MLPLRIYSDIHQELREDKELFNIEKLDNEKEQILILAGDIDQIKNFKNNEGRKLWLKNLSERFYAVLYVFGNHEYYRGKIGNSYEEKNREIFKDIENLHILSRSTPTVIIDNVKFIGASLWTPLKDAGFLDHNVINDVKSIKSVNKGGYRKFGKESWREEHNLDLEWITKELNDMKTVIISHHAPILTNDPRDKEGKYLHHNCCELEDLIKSNNQIKLWIHGHVHQKDVLKREVGETIVFSNTIGTKMVKDEPNRSLFYI